MKEYIKVFSSVSDYNTFKSSANYYRPNISYINSAQTVLYNPISNQPQQGQQDNSKDYLTFIALTNSTFQFSNDIDYSTDGGVTWVTLSSNTSTSTINAGDMIMWKASLTPTSSGIGTFSSTGTFVARGNIMSLLFGNNFENLTSIYGKNYAFCNLFYNCSGLTNSLNLLLPATTLSSGCYKSMFSGCTNLVSSPSLPATVLTEGCYESMFSGCTSLNIVPELSAPILVQDCYKSMFYGCSSVDYIKCLATNISATDCTDDWVNGVASTGTFIKAYGNSLWIVGNNGIPTDWQSDVESNYSQQYLTFRLTTTGEFTFTFTSSSYSLEYSIDEGATWTTLSGYTPQLSAGTKILWRGSLRGTSYNGAGKFVSTANFTIEGNILSIVYGDDFASYDDAPSGQYGNYVFHYLFANCVGLTRAENLILPTLLDSYEYTFSGCTALVTAPKLPCVQRPQYSNMFEGCISLIYPPELPSTLLAYGGYREMFKDCTSLIKAPELPATEIPSHCYSGMFKGCISLTEAPELSATLLNENCYSEMFSGCIHLTEAPELPAIIMADYCYQKMFYNCSSLTKAPSLLYATNLFYVDNTLPSYGCYNYMFYGCTSLTKAPDILTTHGSVNYCCMNMFENCTNLNYVKCLMDNLNTYVNAEDWLKGVSNTGTFVKTSGITYSSSGNGIPTGWTVIEI